MGGLTHTGAKLASGLMLLALLFNPSLAFADASQQLPPPQSRQGAAPPVDGHGYINSDGNWVHSPVHTPNDEPPPGASARCRDGSYSFSRHHQGTCSHHGGVLSWL